MDLGLFVKAYDFAREAHGSQRRRTGELYITHPLAVAQIALDHGHADPILLQACLLHDVVEDTPYTLLDIQNSFGESVAFLVDAVTHVKGDDVATLQKLSDYAHKDPRAVLVKLADRIHNVSTPLSSLEWRSKYCSSTAEYLSLAREIVNGERLIDTLQKKFDELWPGGTLR
jgi:GTP pyrophosphokinase